MSRKTFTAVVCTLAAVVLMAATAQRASAQGPELSLGYAHSTGNFGVDGFNAGAAYWFNHSVTVAIDYDSLYDTSRIDAFGFTPTGLISSHSHLQTLMLGPRIFFSDQQVKRRTITPFAEFQVGYTRLHSDLRQATFPNLHISDNAFAWLLGGGADYRFDPHWSARVKLGLLRTHLADAGQTRLKFALGVSYTFGEHPFSAANRSTRP
jgi:hypothetical protein